MGKVIGIDLGTTNTAVAVLKGSRPEVLEDDKKAPRDEGKKDDKKDDEKKKRKPPSL